MASTTSTANSMSGSVSEAMRGAGTAIQVAAVPGIQSH